MKHKINTKSINFDEYYDKENIFYVNIGDIRHEIVNFVFEKNPKIANWRNFATKNYPDKDGAPKL